MLKGLSWRLVVMVGAITAILAPANAGASTYTNPNAIGIPDSGVASPYPSTISVTGLPGAVVRARVTLTGLVHTYPNDLDTLLVAPNGARTILMSAACGDGDTGEGATGQTFTFDDAAASFLPQELFCPSGTYRPSIDPGATPTFDPPAPAGPQTVAAMSALNGGAAEGTWQLFINDVAAGDLGSIAGGWSLDLLTDAACSREAATLTGTAGPDQLVGTPAPDVILGFGGKDEISGLGSGDTICGGPGKDELKGGSGKDELLGQGGEDELKGGKGDDKCKGGKGEDDADSCEAEKSI